MPVRAMPLLSPSRRKWPRPWAMALIGSLLFSATAWAISTLSRADGRGHEAAYRYVAPRAMEGALQNVRFAYYDDGILPREEHVQKGRVVISVTDHTTRSAGLVVERVTGAAPERAALIERPRQGWRTSQEMKLGPGTYRVYDLNRPSVQATLVVEP